MKVVRFPQNMEAPASNDPRDWLKHAICLAGRFYYTECDIMVLGAVPSRLPEERALVINVPLPELFLSFLHDELDAGTRLYLTAEAVKPNLALAALAPSSPP